jgi:hypothetical protein
MKTYSLLERLRSDGHRVLVRSRKEKMLRTLVLEAKMFRPP